MLHINEDVAFGVQTVPGDGALFIPLPCLSQVCSMHSILKNGKLDAAWKKKNNRKGALCPDELDFVVAQ